MTYPQAFDGHIITLRHLRGDGQQAECRCGWAVLGVERMVRAEIMVHRMLKVPAVRERLTR